MSTRATVLEAWANRAVAETVDGRLVAFHFPRRLERPLPGDEILLNERDELDELLPRRNRFGRGDNRGQFRPIAANLDQTLIVIAAEPAPSPDLLHRYLAASRICGIEPIIVLNKTDLPTPSQAPFDELEGLIELGYSVIRTCCTHASGIDGLAERLEGRTSLIAGQSGVGKTSLVNALIPELDRQTGALSQVTGKGRHTTTSARLCHLPEDSGWLVDTPGVWEYGLWQMTPRELLRGFPEFLEASDGCRFRDCSHQHEPGCGVRAAVEAGVIPDFRYRAWLRLLDEQARLSRS
ncbi:ribosome small subunit-dependent GTPase A [Wenzhouxiangella marina]|uniref:Small ribosomal subunit biogenesis GTPase RsgA n=1 Tax=Wenzhouxiangella marina TaxID=1579979 RepID=A0A0K0XW27_9GAMM|nr:ribosome small subunit-dependent GTPase A [Wenzhouxiangella marina]AKS41909.1 Putative ribosome biogenesis GTPase RsgA [Wenzhouxiangella marina]MBB6086324.1 ribosome biogenesis GTPase [Wenzhouxiangella marina]